MTPEREQLIRATWRERRPMRWQMEKHGGIWEMLVAPEPEPVAAPGEPMATSMTYERLTYCERVDHFHDKKLWRRRRVVCEGVIVEEQVEPTHPVAQALIRWTT